MLITITLEDLEDGGVEFIINRVGGNDDDDTSANVIAINLEKRLETIFDKAREMAAQRRAQEAGARSPLH